MIGAWGYS